MMGILDTVHVVTCQSHTWMYIIQTLANFNYYVTTTVLVVPNITYSYIYVHVLYIYIYIYRSIYIIQALANFNYVTTTVLVVPNITYIYMYMYYIYIYIYIYIYKLSTFITYTYYTY